jgi:hypothetical protein
MLIPNRFGGFIVPTSGELIAKFVELRDQLKLMDEEYSKIAKPYKEGLSAIENALLAEMQASDITQIKCEFGTAFQKQWMSVKTVDREALFRYVIGGEKWELLTAAVSKEVVKEIIEESGGTPPPGVDVQFGIEVQVRRPS